ncbi:serine hydrolase domain-containing protein [Azospirillum endophyticum]
MTHFPTDRLTALAAEFAEWETTVPVDLHAFKLRENLTELGEGDFAAIRGPLPPRGPATGVIAVAGETLAAWGIPEKPDVAFSVTKAALGTLAGLALADGRIASLDEPVGDRAPVAEFSGSHNSRVTWRHLLTLTSEWSGSLWGIPDRIDWHRAVPKRPDAPPKGSPRDLAEPGGHWEFNDVRVNALALALTVLFRNDLETVFRHRILAPIGGGPGFAWNGFDGATVELDGRAVPVVTGGGHWGGGLVVSTDDLARFATLQLRRGVHGDARILPDAWFDALRVATPHNPSFGLMWWNNRAGAIPTLSPEAIWASGIANFVAIDPAHDLVVALRWYDVPRRDTILARITSALETRR